MKRGPLVATFSLGLMVGVALVPTAALAGGRHDAHGGGGGMVSRGRPSGSHHHGFKSHHGFHHHGFKHHHGFRPFFSPGVVTVWAPPLYYGAPVYYPPPAYYPPVYAPPAVYVPPAPAPPPTPSVFQYPHGRYELRGDGVRTPYTWVWIPNPPPAAPPAPPGEPPREQPPSGNGSVAPTHQIRLYPGNGSPPQPIRLYRWTDEQGVVHWTDRPDAVPQRYRTQAKHAPPS